MKYQLTLNNINYLVEQNGTEVKLSDGKKNFAFEILPSSSGQVVREGNFFYAKIGENHWEGTFQKETHGAKKEISDGVIRSPFPGKVTKVHITQKTRVDKDTVLLVVEAMKMEYEIVAPFDGVIEKLLVKLGDQTKKDQVLVEIKKN